jgi:hypothetical protein
MNQATAERGADILRRYRHPESWENGASTLKHHLAGKMVLKVEELRLGGDAFVNEEDARENAAAIRVFAQSAGLPPYKLTLDQVQGRAPYVVVPAQYFESEVLPILQAL